MKTLTKKQVYVVIDNQSDCDRAIEILTKAGEKQWSYKCAFNFDEVDRYIGDKTQVTLDELESLLNSKIKKSDLLNRIEVLEKKVADLECKGTIEVEAEEPQFEVGKVYKGESVMFYCTRIKNEKLYGFGFAGYFGKWCEDDDNYWDGDFTEATPEEWFNRLEEEAKKRGYVKGVEVNNIHMSYTQKIDGKLEIWNQGRSLAVVGLFGLIMGNGIRWK